MAKEKDQSKDDIKTLRDKCAELYDNPDDVEHVVQEAIKLGTVGKILSGERRLPSPNDVATRHERHRRQAELDRGR